MRENDFPGTFIVVEGPDGSGTSTQARKLAEELDAFYTAEHTDRINGKEFLIGQKVEEMISSEGYSAEAIALGFAADRMVHLEEEIIPRLRQGETVICDRYYHSSLTYQPALGADYDWVKTLNKAAIRPDLTIVLGVSAEEGLSRIEKRGPDGNIFEKLDFQQEVMVRYRRLPDRLDEDIRIVDGSKSIEEVRERVGKIVKQRLEL